ncbi:hypothetical protein HOD75_03185 [archaeon]|jgi:hypothetical protein|nr:hypothetical protein [archaeon]MBT4241877.1 hypothetical protein [archaeon]MBT4418424.1 hypothetical protein [archaeon]
MGKEKKSKKKKKGLPKQARYEVDQERSILGNVKIHGLAEETSEDVRGAGDEAYDEPLLLTQEELNEAGEVTGPIVSRIAEEIYGLDPNHPAFGRRFRESEHWLWHPRKRFKTPKDLEQELKELSYNPKLQLTIDKCDEGTTLRYINRHTLASLDNPEGIVRLKTPRLVSEDTHYIESIGLSKQIEERGFNVLAITHGKYSPQLIYASPIIMERLEQGYIFREKKFNQLKSDMERLRAQADYVKK